MNQLKAGAALSYVNILINLIIGLVYTPIMIRLLGQSEYGLYSLIGALVGYLSILDMGLGNAIVRYTARNRTIGDKKSENQLNGMFLALYFFIGILAIIVGTILYFNIGSIFATTLTEQELEKAKLMMIFLIFNVAFSFPLSIFSSIMQAYERFVFLRICNILRTLLNPLFVLPFLYIGYGSVMIVMISTLLNIICLLVNVYYCLKYLDIHVSFGKFDCSILKEIAVYSFFIFLNIIMDKLYWSTGQFILGMVSGTMAVAVYSIAVQIILIYSSFSTAISSLMLPKVTMMVANKVNDIELSNIMIKIGRLQYIVLSYVLCLFIICGESFIVLWAGKEYIDAYYMIMIFMCSMIVSLIQTVGIAILQAKNRNGFRTVVYVIAAIVNVIISIPLAKAYGGFGCAVGISLAILISTGLIINLYYYYKIGLNIPLFWRNIFWMSRPVCFVLVLGYIANFILGSHDLLLMCIKMVFFTVLFFAGMYIAGMNHYEKRLIMNVFRLIKIKI